MELKEISNIKDDDQERLFKYVSENGWKKVYEYDNFDAWIDHGEVRWERNNETLTYVWTNWFEGTLKGTEKTLNEIQKLFQS